MGLCSAYFLRTAGWDVTLLDEGDLADGTSYGNAGMVVPSHFIPLAAPGVIWKGIKWMFNPKSPFAITKKVDLDLLVWLWNFYRASHIKRVQRAMVPLKIYNELSRDLYRKFASEFAFSFEQKGLLMLYQEKSEADAEITVAEQAHALGMAVEVLSQSDLEQLEPNLKIQALGGVYYRHDAHLAPHQFMLQLKKKLVAMGAIIKTTSSVQSLNMQGDEINSITLHQGETLKVEEVVLTAGSKTSELLHPLRIKLPLQPGKGYSLTTNEASVSPTIPSILCEAKVAVTPMDGDLRIGGTMEIGNHSAKINSLRIRGITESLPRYYPSLANIKWQTSIPWQGYRPCTPDGLPYLGRFQKISNLVIATGHAMMGMSMGPATGLLVSEILAEKKTSIPIELFIPERFG